MALRTPSSSVISLFTLALAVLAGSAASSQTSSKRLAVLEFRGDGIKNEVKEAFAEAVRGGVGDGLVGRGVRVMDRENMMVLLREMGKKECEEGECEVETARNIGADFVVSGSVVKVDDVFVVTLKLHETKEGSRLDTDQIEAKTQIEVLRSLREHGRALVAKNINPRPASPAPSRLPAVESASAPAPAPAPPPVPEPVAPCAANQISIPGGTFWMGSKDGDDDENPVHKVTLSPYCIDKTEVTVAAYRECVKKGKCQPPDAQSLCTWGEHEMAQHPINCVDWKQAVAYCAWSGGRLPTEAEWEFAARGNDDRLYPWGKQRPNMFRLNMVGKDDGWEYTAPVGSYSKGASPFGVLDMAGNVWEWTADVYGPYPADPQHDPQSTRSDASPHVNRGGSWDDYDPYKVRAAKRSSGGLGNRSNNLGFRCARGAKM
jgi:formylglycine-generating enzyme required for sulfatase activity